MPPKDDVLEPVYDYAIEAEDTTGLKKAYDSYLHRNHPNVENHNDVSGGRDYSYRRPTESPEYTRYESSDIPYEYHDKGHENDEVFDNVNEEEQGQYELKNYRQPIKVSKHYLHI